VTGQGAVFLRDSGVRTITSVLQRDLSTRSGVAGSTFRTLSEIGISTQLDGTLAIDEVTLQRALEADSASV
jgi:flagellar capping protein FliD